MVEIKLEPELQHVLAHVLRAVQFVSEAVEFASQGEMDEAGNHARAARFECDCIESMVTFDGDHDFVNHVGKGYGVSRQERREEAQVQEESGSQGT
jgi:hypothetical protein